MVDIVIAAVVASTSVVDDGVATIIATGVDIDVVKHLV